MNQRLKIQSGERIYKLCCMSHWDADGDEDDDRTEYLFAGPSRAAVEAFLVSHNFHLYLDSAYPVISRLHTKGYGRAPLVDLRVTEDGVPVEYAESPSTMLDRMRQEAVEYMVFATPTEAPIRANMRDIRVLNPGDCDGRTWLLHYRPYGHKELLPLIVEAKSAEAALDAFDDHPLSYGNRINPLHVEAKAYGIYMERGATLPGQSGGLPFKVGVGAWLTLDGEILPDASRKLQIKEPHQTGRGRYWYDDSWRISGDETKPQPFPVTYKLPSGNVVDPLKFATPPECLICGADAREHYTDPTLGTAVTCSRKCLDKAKADYVLMLPSGGSKKGRDKRLVYGPIAGYLAAVQKGTELAETLEDVDDVDEITFIELRPLTAVPQDRRVVDVSELGGDEDDDG